MDSVQWARISSIFLDALERPVEERAAFLDRACDRDSGARREVESLLAESDADQGFLETPLVCGLPEEFSGELEGTPEARYIGGYRLVRRLGRGGMGDVYLAVQEADGFRQTVALKVIRPGLDTEEVLRRFRLERKILASLSHPNIARLHDGGATEEGRPFFVMEYVDGLPIDGYSDAKRLTVRRRLELFQAVAAAVQHAHQNLVVHRDIKPNNILVTGGGVPKLLDFGIGKVLETALPSSESALQTRLGDRPFTPEYAAPEQIRSAAVTTATDVYALGVLLYQLLSGHHPHEPLLGSVADLERAVCEADPEAPSLAAGRSVGEITPEAVSDRRDSDPRTVRRTLAGDLDNVVLMAMRKEPVRRYPSASALADDVQRYLDGLPVRARPNTFGYRAAKFVRRQAWAVTAAAAILLALTATAGVSLVQSRRVAEERDNALEERDKAVEVRGFLMEMFGATGPDQAADAVTARQLLDLQRAGIRDAYADQPELRAEMMDVLADGYDRLGLLNEAEPWAREALELRRETFGADHPEVAASLNTLGWISHGLGRPSESERLLREAVSIRRAGGQSYRLLLSRSLNDLGVVMDDQDRLDEAVAMYQEALAIRIELLGPNHRGVGITASNLAVSLYRKADYSSASRYGVQALSALQHSVGPDHQRSILAQANLAFMQRANGELGSAEAVFRDLVERQTRLQGRDHPITAQVMLNLAAVLEQAGRLEEAEVLLRETVEIRERMLGDAHPDVATSLSALGGVLVARGSFEEAEITLERAVALLRGLYGETSDRVALAYVRLARVHDETGRPERALDLYQRAVAIWDEVLGPDHPRTTSLREEIAARTEIGRDAIRR